MSEYGREYTDYQLNRSWFRRWVRNIYLDRAARLLPNGPCIDFGCGVGELLRRLPAGSTGLEYNPETVAHCQGIGLDVEWYDGSQDGWQLGALPSGRRYESIVMSHVLEHLENPDGVLAALLLAAGERGADTALVIVPGMAGFRLDPTHRTFIDLPWIQQVLSGVPGWRLAHYGYFPANSSWIGNLFPHNELQVIARRQAH
jgi:hypothetical protein